MLPSCSVCWILDCNAAIFARFVTPTLDHSHGCERVALRNVMDYLFVGAVSNHISFQTSLLIETKHDFTGSLTCGRGCLQN